MDSRWLLRLGLVLVAVGACLSPALAQTAGAPSAGDPASAANASASEPTAVVDQAYVLGPGDTIEAQVVGRQDFDAHVRIGADGAIQVPFLGNVQAGGRTAAQLSDQLATALVVGGYFAKPIMRVEIVGYASQYVTVLGAVVTPGLIPVDRTYHVSDIIARVGGMRETAADYVILRSRNGDEKRLLIKSLATGDTSQDPVVTPGDKIFSPVADTFFVSGEVNTPGAYALTSDMTLRMAIARGGGLTYRGTEHAVKVTRGGVPMPDVQLDSKVEPGDVIVVRERYF